MLLGALPSDDRSSFLYEANEADERHAAVAWYYETDREADDIARDVAERLGGVGCVAVASPGVRYRCGEYECYLTLLPPAPARKTVYAITAAWRASE